MKTIVIADREHDIVEAERRIGFTHFTNDGLDSHFHVMTSSIGILLKS